MNDNNFISFLKTLPNSILTVVNESISHGYEPPLPVLERLIAPALNANFDSVEIPNDFDDYKLTKKIYENDNVVIFEMTNEKQKPTKHLILKRLIEYQHKSCSRLEIERQNREKESFLQEIKILKKF